MINKDKAYSIAVDYLRYKRDGAELAEEIGGIIKAQANLGKFKMAYKFDPSVSVNARNYATDIIVDAGYTISIEPDGDLVVNADKDTIIIKWGNIDG